MNQFRDLLIGALILLAIGLGLGHPEGWTWAASGGAYVVESLNFLTLTRPWSILILIALALALFMTRLKY
jgi:hypothetical protein